MKLILEQIDELNYKINRKSRKLSIRQKDAFPIFLFSFLALLAYFIPDNNIKFVVATVFTIYIIFRAKVSYFSAFTFILWFSFLQQYIAVIDRSISSGMLKSGWVPIYYDELYLCIILFLLCELIFFSFTSVLYRERKMYLLKIEMSWWKAYLIGVCSLLLVIMSYPSLPSLSAILSRNAGYIESARYTPIALFLLSITYDSLRKYKGLIILWITVIFWILFHGERVLVMGLLVYFAIKYLSQNSENKSGLLKTMFKGKRKLIIFAAIAVVLIGVYIQYSRIEIDRSLSIMDVVAQATAGDVVYVFNCSVDLWKNNNLLNGYSFLRYVTDLLPGQTNVAMSPAVLITDYYYTVGGGLFFVEPIMNFGIYGVVPYIVFIFFILNLLLKKPNLFTAMLWAPVVITIFRATWYCGFLAWKIAIYISPILYLFIVKLKLCIKNRSIFKH